MGADLKKIRGRIVAAGPVVYDGVDNASEPAAIYRFLRLVDEAGQEIYLEHVHIPAFLDSLISSGTVGTFYVMGIPIPKPFGSKPFYFVYALNIDGRLSDAIAQTNRLLRACKAGALRLAWFGLILLAAWGFGVVLWIQAVRLLSLSMPEAEMQRSLQ